MWSVSAQPERFDEAIKWFREKLLLPEPLFRWISDRAKQRAFWVAGVMRLDILAWLWKSLSQAIEEGTPYGEWANQVAETLRQSWGGPKPGRLETIFRTNVQSAYSAGRYAQLTDPKVLQTRSFWMYDAVLDSRTTEICRVRHGTIKAADDPWWKTNYPPLHFNCRAGVRALTPEEAARRGIKPVRVGIPPQEGFGLAPERDVWEETVASEIRRDAREAWVPAMNPIPTWADYGLPELLPLSKLPSVKPLNGPGYVETPSGVILVDKNPPVSMEILTAILTYPTEIWVLPVQSGERATFRMYYLVSWEPDVAYVLVSHRGIVVDFLKLSPGDLNKYRRGVLYYISGEK